MSEKENDSVVAFQGIKDESLRLMLAGLDGFTVASALVANAAVMACSLSKSEAEAYLMLDAMAAAIIGHKRDAAKLVAAGARGRARGVQPPDRTH